MPNNTLETQDTGSDYVIATVEADPDIVIRDNAENSDDGNSTNDESGEGTQDSQTQDAPANENEDPEIDLSAIYETLEGDSREASAVKPLDFIDSLPDDAKEAYRKQVDGLNKLVARDSQYREVAGTHDVEAIKTQIATGKQFQDMAVRLTTAETQAEAVAQFLDELEQITGKTLEEFVPERFGYEASEEELQLRAREKRVADMEAKVAEQNKVAAWVSSDEPAKLIEAFKKQTGFVLDAAKVAPFVLAGKSPVEAVRAAHSKEWESHLIDLGYKKGLKESRSKSTADLPADKKSVETVQYYESGPFKGLPIPRG